MLLLTLIFNYMVHFFAISISGPSGSGIPVMYYATKKSTWFCYFDACLMHNVGRDSDRRWHDSLSMYYKDKESCHNLSKTPPILCVKRVSK